MARSFLLPLAILSFFSSTLSLVVSQAQPWIPKTLECTPWSWALCKSQGKGMYKVMVNEEGGGGMQAPGHYLNGIFSLDMQLTKGNSGGVNFAWYLMDTISLSNKDPLHSEIDVEFYGNTTGDTAMLALNVFANGKQNLAQFRLPFDASAALHTYTIRWSATQISWLVDGKPIRVLNKEAGKPWPMHAMKPMASVWSTPWTDLKADFTNGPIVAQYGNFKAEGCKANAKDVQKVPVHCVGSWNTPFSAAQLSTCKELRAKTLIVDYGWDNA